MANFDAFHWGIKLRINLLFRKSNKSRMHIETFQLQAKCVNFAEILNTFAHQYHVCYHVINSKFTSYTCALTVNTTIRRGQKTYLNVIFILICVYKMLH